MKKKTILLLTGCIAIPTLIAFAIFLYDSDLSFYAEGKSSAIQLYCQQMELYKLHKVFPVSLKEIDMHNRVMYCISFGTTSLNCDSKQLAFIEKFRIKYSLNNEVAVLVFTDAGEPANHDIWFLNKSGELNHINFHNVQEKIFLDSNYCRSY